MGIIIVGETGSGKSTIGQIVSLKTGFDLYEIGHEVKKVYLERVEIDQHLEIVNEKDYSTTNQRLKYTDAIVKKYGNDYYVKRILERHKSENIIIIGARSMAEINAIRNKMHFPFFVGFTCAENEIERRFVERETKFMSQDEARKIFEERKKREEKWGTDSVLTQANTILATDYNTPNELADIIVSKYKEFIKQQADLKKEKDDSRC